MEPWQTSAAETDQAATASTAVQLPIHNMVHRRWQADSLVSRIANRPAIKTNLPALKILNSTYALPKLLRARLYDQIEAVPPANGSRLGQRITLCSIKDLRIQLQKAGKQPASSGLMRIIRRKLLIATRNKFGNVQITGQFMNY